MGPEASFGQDCADESLSEMGNQAYSPPQRVQTSFGQDWEDESLSKMGNPTDSPPQRIQTAPVESLSEMGNPTDSPPQRVQTAPVVLVHVSNCSSSWKDLPIVMMEQ